MTEVSEPTITTPKRKKISDLTDQEKAQIIAEIKAGKTNEFYDIKFFNNGNTTTSSPPLRGGVF